MNWDMLGNWALFAIIGGAVYCGCVAFGTQKQKELISHSNKSHRYWANADSDMVRKG